MKTKESTGLTKITWLHVFYTGENYIHGIVLLPLNASSTFELKDAYALMQYTLLMTHETKQNQQMKQGIEKLILKTKWHVLLQQKLHPSPLQHPLELVGNWHSKHSKNIRL